MTSRPAYDKPTRVFAVHGEVVLDGPDGIALSMTPDAAAETARRLEEAVIIARGQSPATEDDADVTAFEAGARRPASG